MAPGVVAPGADPDVLENVRTIMSSAHPTGVAGALRGMAERPDSTPLLSSIRIPACVILGAQDQLLPAADSRAIAEGIAGAAAVEIQGAGHIPSLERPEATTKALLDLF
jgi:pimeloyl-ACP methyl ester carboxylesterase